jgi:uncharacterized protein (DUF433 family)
VETVLNITEIISDPAVRGGRPIIAGTTLRVSDVVAYYVYAGRTPEELAVGFSLDMGQVFAALAYYHLHKTDIDAEMRQNAAEADHWMNEAAKQARLIRFD